MKSVWPYYMSLFYERSFCFNFDIYVAEVLNASIINSFPTFFLHINNLLYSR